MPEPGISVHRSLATLGLCILFICLLASCTLNKMYQSDDGVVVSAEQNGTNYSYSCIEFDDMGDLWTHNQLINTVNNINKLTESGKPVLLFVFIHGWNHNASSKDDNFEKFHRFLRKISKSDTRKIYELSSTFRQKDAALKENTHHVYGVYLGWRGKGSPLPFAQQLTFWSRKRAARRIAGTSATEVLAALVAASRQASESRIILIGHSFGGLILERSVAQAMAYDLVREAYDPNFRAEPLADLTLLLNPASESLLAKQFVNMLQRRNALSENSIPSEKPWIISVTSEKDNATGIFFPVGASIENALKVYRTQTNQLSHLEYNDRSQLYFMTHTSGHNDALKTHQMLRTDKKWYSQEEYTNVYHLTNFWSSLPTDQFTNVVRGGESVFTLCRANHYTNNAPYWIMQVPKKIIPDHGALFDLDFQGLIGFLMRVSQDPSAVPFIDDARNAIDLRKKMVKERKRQKKSSQTNNPETVDTSE